MTTLDNIGVGNSTISLEILSTILRQAARSKESPITLTVISTKKKGKKSLFPSSKSRHANVRRIEIASGTTV